MFRTVLLKSARSAASQAVRRAGPITRSASAIQTFQYAPSVFNAARCYSAAAGLAKPEVEGRIVDLLKNFDKVRLHELEIGPI
jgi:NADH dehydrogenase (ubiquinone) 1 alpha/beta subcomplex 1, acyl-carrier protein